MYLWFCSATQLGWAQETPQYQTLKRIQKTFLVRCNVGTSTTFSFETLWKKSPKRNAPEESLTKIIPGNGVRPASQIRPESAVLCLKYEVYFNFLKTTACRRLEKQLKWGAEGDLWGGVSGKAGWDNSWAVMLNQLHLGLREKREELGKLAEQELLLT